MHSVWSDGRDTIETMVSACRDLGYEYMAITDHSPASGLTHTLTVHNVRRQADEVDALRERFPDIAILHGCEVDILPDGRLDFPDRVLERFDLVLASLHHRAGHGPDQLLRRYLAAVRHPLVTLITHPTNRLVPHRPGYDLDYDRLIEAAAETGTLLEIDGAPVAPRHGRRAFPAGDRRGSDGHRGQRLPPRGDARASDASGSGHRPPGMGRAATRAEHTAARRRPRIHRPEARALNGSR